MPLFLESYKKALSVILKKPFTLWGLSLLSGLIVYLSFLFTIPFFIVGIAFSWLISCGMTLVYIDGLKEREVNSDQLFAGLKNKPMRIVGGMAWQALWLIIWGMIPIAGPFLAVWKGYQYAFVPYILITKPDVSATQALRLSKSMTNGYKLQMWLADLVIGAAVFVVYLILGILSAIPILGLLFALILFLVGIAIALFGNIFTGLYKAYFFVYADEGPVAPVQIGRGPAQPVYQQPVYQQPMQQPVQRPVYQQPVQPQQQAYQQQAYRQPVQQQPYNPYNR